MTSKVNVAIYMYHIYISKGANINEKINTYLIIKQKYFCIINRDKIILTNPQNTEDPLFS